MDGAGAGSAMGVTLPYRDKITVLIGNRTGPALLTLTPSVWRTRSKRGGAVA